MASTVQIGLKAALRKRMKDAIKSISPDAKVKQSEAITEKVLQHETFRQAQRISVYLSTTEEVSTTELLREMFRLEKLVFVPTYDGPKMKMVRLCDMDEYDELPLTKWHIKQPNFKENREDAMTNGHGIDLFIMPGVAFTRDGARLGHGMGYYDTYLCQHAEKYPQKKITHMALAFNEQIIPDDQLPMESHDVRLHSIITAKSLS